MAVSCLQADLRSCGGGVDLRVLSSFPQALQSDKYKIFPNSLSFSISFPSSLRRDATVQDIYVFGISKPRCSLCALICFPNVSILEGECQSGEVVVLWPRPGLQSDSGSYFFYGLGKIISSPGYTISTLQRYFEDSYNVHKV